MARNLVWAGIVALLVIGGAVLWVARGVQPKDYDSALARERSHTLLERHAKVFAAWREEHPDRWPESWIELRGFSKTLPEYQHLTLKGVIAPEVGTYKYRPPTPDGGPDQVIMATTGTHPPIRPDAEGLEGASVGFVLTRDLEVQTLTADEHRARTRRLFPEGQAD